MSRNAVGCLETSRHMLSYRPLLQRLGRVNGHAAGGTVNSPFRSEVNSCITEQAKDGRRQLRDCYQVLQEGSDGAVADLDNAASNMREQASIASSNIWKPYSTPTSTDRIPGLTVVRVAELTYPGVRLIDTFTYRLGGYLSCEIRMGSQKRASKYRETRRGLRRSNHSVR